MPSDLLLVVRTARHRYIVARDDVTNIRRVANRTTVSAEGLMAVELGPLLDPHDRSETNRCCALLLPLRRRTIALLVDDIETFHQGVVPQPLPNLLARCLNQPWASGALLLDGELIIRVDLRAVARSALKRTAPHTITYAS